MLRDRVYLDTPAQWDALAAILERTSIVGLDTEFYGLDVRKESCVGRARIHVWSIAVRTSAESPLGFHRARGFVLPLNAALHTGLRDALEDPTLVKCVHNQPVDDHAFHNHGVDLQGCVNTLGLARWVWPGLVTRGGFGLKNLMQAKLNRAPIAEFKDVVGWERTVQVEKWRTSLETRCACGVEGCRKRKAEGTLSHEKGTVEVTSVSYRDKREVGEFPLESITPGHERWDLLVRYAAEDAVAALEIEELARAEGDPAPFPYLSA